MKNQGLHFARLDAPGGSAQRERAFTELWREAQERNQALDHLLIVTAKEGEPGAYKPFGPFGPAFAKRPLGDVQERDRVVAATVMQWLGTNVGFCLLEQALERAGYKLVQTRFR